MAECLWCVAELFPRLRNFLREDVQMIAKTEHILKDANCLQQIFIVIGPRLNVLVLYPPACRIVDLGTTNPCQGFDEPKGTN